MADFEIAVAKTIKNEGGDKYTETEGDRGGATKYGISKRLYEKLILQNGCKFLITNDDIKNLTLEQATHIYKKYFWDANRYGEINDQVIAEKVFDMAVLMGAPQANLVSQFSINDYKGGIFVHEDKIMGNETISELNCDIDRDFLYVLQINYCKRFLNICNKDKSQSKFLLGWLNRVMS